MNHTSITYNINEILQNLRLLDVKVSRIRTQNGYLKIRLPVSDIDKVTSIDKFCEMSVEILIAYNETKTERSAKESKKSERRLEQEKEREKNNKSFLEWAEARISHNGSVSVIKPSHQSTIVIKSREPLNITTYDGDIGTAPPSKEFLDNLREREHELQDKLDHMMITQHATSSNDITTLKNKIISQEIEIKQLQEDCNKHKEEISRLLNKKEDDEKEIKQLTRDIKILKKQIIINIKQVESKQEFQDLRERLHDERENNFKMESIMSERDYEQKNIIKKLPTNEHLSLQETVKAYTTIPGETEMVDHYPYPFENVKFEDEVRPIDSDDSNSNLSLNTYNSND